MLKKEIYKLYEKISLSKNDANAELDMIYEYLGIDGDICKKINTDFSDEEKHKILEIVDKRISTDEPLQYILGFSYFANKKFYVNKNVLIPRPETEFLINAVKDIMKPTDKILDIGIGSGCISIMLQKHTSSVIDGVDISEDAIVVAKENAKLHKVNCNFFKSDLFEKVTDKYDIIVSNPPYIPISEKNSLEKNVKDFEPHAALFAYDEKGIEFYEKIIKQSATYLNKGGYLAFEIGIRQSSAITELLTTYSFSDIKIINDFDNIERVTIAKYS